MNFLPAAKLPGAVPVGERVAVALAPDILHLLRCRERETHLKGLVGARGFEPPASCSRSKRTTRLYYAPTEPRI